MSVYWYHLASKQIVTPQKIREIEEKQDKIGIKRIPNDEFNPNFQDYSRTGLSDTWHQFDTEIEYNGPLFIKETADHSNSNLTNENNNINSNENSNMSNTNSNLNIYNNRDNYNSTYNVPSHPYHRVHSPGKLDTYNLDRAPRGSVTEPPDRASRGCSPNRGT